MTVERLDVRSVRIVKMYGFGWIRIPFSSRPVDLPSLPVCAPNSAGWCKYMRSSSGSLSAHWGMLLHLLFYAVLPLIVLSRVRVIHRP